MKYFVKTFRYFEPMWLGYDNKVSIRRFLALFFSGNFIINLRHIIINWESDKSYADAALLLGIEAGLIAALLSLTTYSNSLGSKSHDTTFNPGTE
jgi:hypothetical protein